MRPSSAFLNTVTIALLALPACYANAAWYSNLYFGVEGGYSKANYSMSQFIGTPVTSLSNSGLATHLMLGRNFNRYVALAFNVIYVNKPRIRFVENGKLQYKNIKNNMIFLAPRFSLPIGNRLILAAHAGIGYVPRTGLTINNATVLKKGQFNRFIYGTSAIFHIKSGWDATGSWFQAPSKGSVKLPVTNFYGGGISYTW